MPPVSSVNFAAARASSSIYRRTAVVSGSAAPACVVTAWCLPPRMLDERLPQVATSCANLSSPAWFDCNHKLSILSAFSFFGGNALICVACVQQSMRAGALEPQWPRGMLLAHTQTREQRMGHLMGSAKALVKNVSRLVICPDVAMMHVATAYNLGHPLQIDPVHSGKMS
jgi:hypothetical protein